MALNARRMSDVGEEPHDRSLPLTGAIFDTMIEVFQQELVRRNLISPDLREQSTNLPGTSADLIAIEEAFAAAFQGREPEFKESLLLARDYLGRLLAVTWGSLSADILTYHDVLRGLIRADRQVAGGANQAIIRDCFAWREIAPVPDSLLLRPHTLQDCGLRAVRSADGATRVIMRDNTVAGLAAGDGRAQQAMAAGSGDG